MRHVALLSVAGAISSLCAASSIDAQVRASEAASVSQTIDGTVITLTYSRPQARGRIALFGGLVHHGQMWTPGANWATTIEASKDVRVNGAALAAGKYSVWMVPDEDEWAVIFEPDDHRFHTQRPRESDEQIRVAARPDSVPHTEVLTWSFPAVRRDGATLELRWGTTRLALDVAVQPTGRGLRAGPADAYAGTYRMRFTPPLGESTEHTANVFERDSVLYLRVTPPPFAELVLRSAGTHRFTPVFQKEEGILDVEVDATLIFTVENGRASRVELRAIDGQSLATGVRQ